MNPHGERLGFRVRGAAAGLAAATAALLAFALVAFTVMGTAGADWETPTGKATLVVALCVLSFFALAVGAAVGVWQAAAGGAHSPRAAALAGGTAPALAALIVNLALAAPTAGGLAGGLASGIVMAAGAACGAWVLARRLDDQDAGGPRRRGPAHEPM